MFSLIVIGYYGVIYLVFRSNTQIVRENSQSKLACQLRSMHGY